MEDAELAARLARLQDAAATTRVTTMSLASMSLDDDDFGGAMLSSEAGSSGSSSSSSGAGGGWSSASGGAGGNGVDGDVEALQRINVVLKADAAGACLHVHAQCVSRRCERLHCVAAGDHCALGTLGGDPQHSRPHSAVVSTNTSDSSRVEVVVEVLPAMVPPYRATAIISVFSHTPRVQVVRNSFPVAIHVQRH